MRLLHFLYSLIIIFCGYSLLIANTGCGQIGMPTGGPRDSIPPRLLKATPELQSTHVSGNKITLTFNEYVEIKDAQTNVLISPYPQKTPSVDYKLKTVTVKFRDTLIPNTTYSINFGNAIVDINEGNPLKDFTYVFSTGSTIDSLTLAGKVIIAETGKADSTLVAMLYRNADDSAVQKRKPDYIARLHGDGSFLFVNLPTDNFRIYALKDGDGGKTYNSKKELFAFSDNVIAVSENTAPVILYASAIEKESPGLTTSKPTGAEKKLRYSLVQAGGLQDLLNPFEISFSKPLKLFDPEKLVLTDSSQQPVPAAAWSIDSSRTRIQLTTKWLEDMQYLILLDSLAFSDSADSHLAKTDTIKFTTKKTEDYGNVILRFSNMDLAKHPVLQFIQGDEVRESYPLKGMEWNNKLMNPGDYDIRILFDDNQNGKWDTGDYSRKLQPEKAITLTQKLSVRANWDNERDIKL